MNAVLQGGKVEQENRSAISRGWCRRVRPVTDDEKPSVNKALEGLHERHDAVPAAGPDLGATE